MIYWTLFFVAASTAGRVESFKREGVEGQISSDQASGDDDDDDNSDDGAEDKYDDADADADDGLL